VPLLLGCVSSKQLSKLPPIVEGVDSATIYIIRPAIFVGGFVGDGLAGFIYLDDKNTFRIAAGDYTAFPVLPYKHTVRIVDTWRSLSRLKYQRLNSSIIDSKLKGNKAGVIVDAKIRAVAGEVSQKEIYYLVK